VYKSLFIVGIEGNMGRRYQAVARYLGIDCSGCDIASLRSERIPPKDALILICTPTEHHLRDCFSHLASGEHDVLCEKPIVKTRDDLEKLKGINLDRLFMVNNYCYTEESGIYPYPGITSYNYYMSGKDGLIWDCIQLFGLAKSRIELQNTSPIWTCIINGVSIERNSIDKSYIEMITDFFHRKEHLWSGQKIIEIHEKVLKYIEKQK
jgi:hypothetical protein